MACEHAKLRVGARPGTPSSVLAAIVSCSILGSAQACASTRRQHTAREPAAATNATTANRTAEALRGLTIAVQALSERPESMSPRTLADAMRRLSKTMDVMANGPTLAPAKLRDAADRIADDRALAAEPAVDGLGIALRHLVTKKPPKARRIDYHQATRGMGHALDTLEDQAVPTEQLPATIASALRSAADLLHLAAGGEAPFGEGETASPQAPDGSWSIEVQVAEARADVLRLGQTNWTEARAAAARALASLADAVAAIDRQGGERAKVSTIRFQAERVRRSDSLTFGQAEWIATGLTAAVDAIDELACEQSEVLAEWKPAARRAIASVQPQRSLSFQRAAVQDAFRATVDVFVLATRSGGPCSER
jgi:hypothetical protein